MASTVQQVEVVPSPTPSADVVGRAFVHQYYLILHKSPELVHRFYQEHSILSRADENGIMSTTTSVQAINDKILSYDCGSQSSDITTVDAQDSYSGGVLVLVTGYLTGANNSRQKFTQSFFLAPQDTGFYVYNDVFRYVVKGGKTNEIQALASDSEGPLTPEQDSPTLQKNQVSEAEAEMSDDVGPEEKVDIEVEVCDTDNRDKEVAVEEEKAPIAVVVAEIPKDSTLVEPISKIEEAPKKSYASILSTRHVKAVKEKVAPLPAPTRPPLRTVQKNQEPKLAAPTPISETVVSDLNVNENGKYQEVEDGFSVYIKGLPMNATRTLVESEFKKFGPIKADGIQVKISKGVCFAFVEFEVATAFQSALEASPLEINGRRVFVEEKRSTFRG